MKKRSPFSSIRKLEDRIVYGGPMMRSHFTEKGLNKPLYPDETAKLKANRNQISKSLGGSDDEDNPTKRESSLKANKEGKAFKIREEEGLMSKMFECFLAKKNKEDKLSSDLVQSPRANVERTHSKLEEMLPKRKKRELSNQLNGLQLEENVEKVSMPVKIEPMGGDSKKTEELAIEKVDIENLEEEKSSFEKRKEDLIENFLLPQESIFFQKVNQVKEEMNQVEKRRKPFIGQEEERGIEFLTPKRRKERILRKIEEKEEFHRCNSNLSEVESCKVQYQYRERPMILEVPEKAELESMYEVVISELKKSGFNNEKFSEMIKGKENSEELRKLINQILQEKLYGRGLYKLIAQQLVYNQLVDQLKVVSDDSRQEASDNEGEAPSIA